MARKPPNNFQNEKHSVIQSMLAQGQRPGLTVIKGDLSRDQAYALEKEVITKNAALVNKINWHGLAKTGIERKRACLARKGIEYRSSYFIWPWSD